MARRESNDLLNPVVEKKITTDEQRPGSRLDQTREGGIDFAVGACFSMSEPLARGLEPPPARLWSLAQIADC